MSDPPWRTALPFSTGNPTSRSLNFIFQLLWVVESMWLVVVPAFCALSSVIVYRQTKSPLYSIFSSVFCGLAWFASRYYILGRVPIFLSPQFKECTSVVRLLLHNINTKLLKRYNYRYPLIVNLGVLVRFYNMTTTLQPHPSDYLDKATALKLSRYMDFAAASYGVLFYPRHAKSSLLRLVSSNNSYSIGSLTSSISVNVISQMTGVVPDDIIVTQLKGENPLRPGYYICLDRENESVVVVIRGTLTLSDALTDVACLSKEFLGGWAHHGISVSAESIYEEVKVILENLLKRTGYNLVLCGHSLGGGTAVLLTLFLLENRKTLSETLSKCDIKCYAYAPPPVFSAHGSGERWSDHITTVINGADIIPRTSLANMYNLLMQLQYIENLDLTLWERCSLIREKKSEKLEDLLLGMDEFLLKHTDSNHEVFKPLYHTGRIVWIDRQHTQIDDTTAADTSLDTSGLENSPCSSHLRTPLTDFDTPLIHQRDSSLFRTPEKSSDSQSSDFEPRSSDLTAELCDVTSNLDEVIREQVPKLELGPSNLELDSSNLGAESPFSDIASDPLAFQPADDTGFFRRLRRQVRRYRAPKRAVLLDADNAAEWKQMYVGSRFIVDHWPHMYQKTLKIFVAQNSD